LGSIKTEEAGGGPEVTIVQSLKTDQDRERLAPDSGTTGILAAKPQFEIAALQIASDLGINKLQLSTDEVNPDEYLLTASGQADSGILKFDFSVSYKAVDVHKTRGPPYVHAALEIEYERQTRWYKNDDITPMVGHPNYLIRWAGWAIHNFNLEQNPVNLERLVGDSAVEVYGGDRLDESLTQFELLVRGLQSSGSKVTVMKFRHVSETIWYRSYSYALWAEGQQSTGLWIFFYNIGGLDSGGWYADYQRVERAIATFGRNATVESHDMKDRVLINFLLRKDTTFPNSIHLSAFEPKSLYPSLSLNDSFSESELGHDAFETYKKAEASFIAEDYAGALRDLRAAVQDALENAVQLHSIDVSGIKDPDVTNLAGILVSKGKLEGRLTPWFGAFTSFANLASHGTYPTEKELENPQIRMRVLGTFVLGRQLLREIEYCVKPFSSLS
jgi:hypothetical protein